MQRDIRFLNALGGELVQQLLRKVQTGCRCGGRAVDFGIDGLVAFAVLQFFLDVRRQRHFSEPFQHLKEDPLIVELHELVAVVPLPYYGRRQIAVSEGQLCPGVRLAARLRKALPDAVSLILEQQHLDRAAGRHPMAEQACGQHTGVVHDQAISWLQKLKQVVKMPVRDLARFPVERHEPGRVAALQRRLRDQLLRQIVIKIMCFQQIQPFPIRRFFPRFTLTGRNEYDMMRPLEFADICPSCKNILFLHKPNVLYYIPK